MSLPFPRRVAILGSSGSIGRSALEVIAASEGRLQVAMMSINRRADILVEQLQQMRLRLVSDQLRSLEKDALPSQVISGLPQCVIMTDEWADRTPLKELPPEVEVRFGQDALCEYVQRNDIDVVLSAIVGSAGFRSTWAAIEAGKTVALANKESLVMGGPLLGELARKTGGTLIPVDSEHSAIMQCLRARKMSGGPESLPSPPYDEISRIILTASGGPFRTWSLDDLAKVTIDDALAHPTWNMGKKITVDSATLMNKALELIEARWLFGLPVEKLTAVLHPQSIVHSLIEFIDGSVMAQMSPPDMQLPIQLALCFPERFDSPARRIDWMQKMHLEFFPIDPQRFPALELGLEVAAAGGTAGAVLNAANETAVEAFLANRLPFTEITTICRTVLKNHNFESHPTLERLFELDEWTRKEAEKRIESGK
ncbi:MAG: 1-deoxy-D-xylulose-5-phosphate reductoisomerase [Planctomycetaceae bacterium]|nr:1-deoxy-D-xylulose-5-phosphate reductoisomerase [Planctomycetaceae bacterium]